mgnify:CR=1 FL=1
MVNFGYLSTEKQNDEEHNFSTNLLHESNSFLKHFNLTETPKKYQQNSDCQSIEMNDENSLRKFNLQTPPASIGKRIISTLKHSKNSQSSFFHKSPKKFGYDSEQSSPRKNKKNIPTPLNLTSSDNNIYCKNVPKIDNNTMSFETLNSNKQIIEQQNYFKSTSKLNLEPALSSLSLTKSSISISSSTVSSNDTESRKHRKNFNNEVCIICQELLRVALVGEKPVPMEKGGFAHFDCFIMSSEIKNLQPKPLNKNINTSQPFTASNNNNNKKPLPLLDLTTPVNQVLKDENINENGFDRMNIKETHQKLKQINNFNDSFGFDVFIHPQFYKVDIMSSSKTLSLPYVIQLNNKTHILTNNTTTSNAELGTKELQIKKDITEKFDIIFPNFFKHYKSFTYKPGETVIDMIDFVDVSINDETYHPHIVILLSNIEYLIFMSIENQSGYVVDMKLLNKAIRLDNSLLIYSKSLKYPEISFKIPTIYNKGDFMDMGFMLDKWCKVLKWKILNKPISHSLCSLATNIFEVVDHDLCSQNLKTFIEWVVKLMPSDILTKIIDIANQKDLDFNYLMPTVMIENLFVNNNNNNKIGNNLATSPFTNKEDSRVICFVINTFKNIQKTLKQFLSKIESNCLIGFIIANGDSTFKYMGFVDLQWASLNDFVDGISIEPESLQTNYCNINNMFLKIDNLLMMNSVSENSHIDIRIFNDQPFVDLGKYFKKTMQKYNNLVVYDYTVGLASNNLETYMEEDFQFIDNYSKLTVNKLEVLNEDIIADQCYNSNLVLLNLYINPDFQDCVSFKNLENAFGHKVFIENYLNINSLQLTLKNELDFKLLMVDLEITDVKKFTEKIQFFENSFSNLNNNNQSIIFYNINNINDVFKSDEITFNIIHRNSFAETATATQLQLKLKEEEEEKDQYCDQSDASSDSSTIELFITTPITSNKEPLYLLRDIELQLVTIIEEIYIQDGKHKNKDKSDIINYYYTIFFSYSKNIDIKSHSNINFNYQNIIEYIDCLFDILLSNDYDKIILAYDMLRYQYRNAINKIK